MALSISRKAKSFLSRLQPFRSLERFEWSFTEEGGRAPFSSDTGASSCSVDVSKWRQLDSRNLGIVSSKLSVPSWIVLKNLRDAGFQAYLVGGCVRDLILNQVPKDFDVITTASLKQVRKKFHRAMIVGRKFPICMVTIKGSMVEVSSFETVTKESRRRKLGRCKMPKGCNPRDLVRWKNCIERDFTVNSLFFDPFVNIIYDYTNAMMDLKSLKLRTVIPANLSFKEDQVRILRGLRLAARLNLTFSEETEDALYSLSSSVADLNTSRLNLEMNYMLSYGAAEHSLLLLKRFKVLEILLPFHAAYLSEQVDNQFGLRSSMFMKLFFHLDQLFACDQPCTHIVWIAILALHQAIFTNPQHAIVISTYGLLLYHRTWEDSIKIAREKAPSTRIYVPEIVHAFDHLSDDEIVERVTKFAEQVANSVDILVNEKCLLKSMARFPDAPRSGLVLVPRKTGQQVKHILNVTADGVNSVEAKERSREINYGLLTKGSVSEIRFVLGKILLRTLVDKKEPPEREATKPIIDDTQLTKPPRKSERINRQPKSAHPSQLHTTENQTSITPPNYEKLPDDATKTRLFGDNNIADEHRLSEETGSESLNICSIDKILKDGLVKAETRSNRPVLSCLFR
ncbi:hypothetical protein ACS0TY_008665 [Phlomoides rotata]